MKKPKRHFYFALLCVAGSFLMSACKKTDAAGTIIPVKTTDTVATTSLVSNPKNLNIIMFVPTDNPALPDYKTRLTTLFGHFQNWLHTEMLRSGYDKYLGLSVDPSTKLIHFIEIKAQFGQAEYPYDAAISAGKILGEISTYKAAHPSEFSSANHTLILLPGRTDGNSSQPFYGYGRNCFAVDNVNMSVDKIPNMTSNLLGGMLHELGHGLNLPHDHGKYFSEEPTLGTSLMSNGNETFSRGQKTFLTEVDAAILNRNEVFQNPAATGVAYEAATATIDARFAYDDALPGFNLTGTFTSDKEVSDILVYMDPDLSPTDADYNAVSWRFNPGAGSTIAGTIPFKELFYKNNEPYNIRVKLLLKNGSTVSKNYSFTFKSGVPQTGINGSAKFYQNGSYGGYMVELPVGEYKTADLIAKGIKDKDISAVALSLGIKVTLYSGDNFTGTSFELTSSSSYLSTFNDKTSSVKITALTN